MTNLSEEIARVRRYLRDPKANIWSNDLLIDLWNEAVRDLQHRTSVLEDVRVVSAPPRFAFSYQHEWEAVPAGDGPLYRMPSQQDFYAYTARWEVQQRAGLSVDAAAIGMTYSHPWEAWYGTTPTLPPWPMPRDALSVKHIWHDLKPLSPTTLRSIQRDDPSWEKRSGQAEWWWPAGDVYYLFYVYPRPTTKGNNDESGAGMVTAVSGDTVGAEVGVIIDRTETVLSQDEGLGVTVLEADSNVLIIYDKVPAPVDSLSSDIDMPAWLASYARRHVLWRAYEANTDGRIPSLSALWRRRYLAGIAVLTRYRVNRLRARTVRLRPEFDPAGRTRRRHARLPDAYPAVNP